MNALWPEQKSWTFFEDSYKKYFKAVLCKIFNLSLCQGIHGYHVLFPALTPRCRYYCEDKEEVEHFRMCLIFWLYLPSYWKLRWYPGLIMMPFFQEESDTRLAVQEALSMMAPSYKNTDSTILALIEALILNYVQQVPAFYNTNNNLSLLEPMIWLAIKNHVLTSSVRTCFW